MALREDAKWAFYATVAEDSKVYGVTLTSGVVTYADLPPGEYNCFVEGNPAGHLRLAYLPITTTTPTPTIGAWGDPTAAASAQVDGTPAGAAGAGVLPSQANLIPLAIRSGFRLALCPNVTATLWCTRVL